MLRSMFNFSKNSVRNCSIEAFKLSNTILSLSLPLYIHSIYLPLLNMYTIANCRARTEEMHRLFCLLIYYLRKRKRFTSRGSKRFWSLPDLSWHLLQQTKNLKLYTILKFALNVFQRHSFDWGRMETSFETCKIIIFVSYQLDHFDWWTKWTIRHEFSLLHWFCTCVYRFISFLCNVSELIFSLHF